MRRIAALLLLVLGGCAQESLVLTPGPPEVPNAGVLAFHSAGSFARGGDGRFSPGPPQSISGELRLPEGKGPFPAVILGGLLGGGAGIFLIMLIALVTTYMRPSRVGNY